MSEAIAQRPVWRGAVLAAAAAVAAIELYTAWLALHPQVGEDYRAYYIDHTTTCLDKPVSNRYALGSTISFLPENWRGAKALWVCGWDGPAGDGAHSVGTSSRLHFGIAPPASGLRLRLYLTAIAAAGQRVVVTTGDGRPLGTARIPAGASQVVDVPVPADAVVPGDGLDVIVAYPDAVRMMPHDSDTHLRAVMLTAVQLRRPGDLPSSGSLDDPKLRQYEPGPGGSLRQTPA